MYSISSLGTTEYFARHLECKSGKKEISINRQLRMSLYVTKNDSGDKRVNTVTSHSLVVKSTVPHNTKFINTNKFI